MEKWYIVATAFDTRMPDYNDDIASEDLWGLFLSGDAHALDVLVKRHYNLLYIYGSKFTYDTCLVKDCIQDLFLDLWRKRMSINHTPLCKKLSDEGAPAETAAGADKDCFSHPERHGEYRVPRRE